MTDFAELIITPTSSHENDADDADIMWMLRAPAPAGFKEAQFLPTASTSTAEAETTSDVDTPLSRLQAFYEAKDTPLKDHDDTLVHAARPRPASKMLKMESNYPA
jgi:hypothetical protein